MMQLSRIFYGVVFNRRNVKNAIIEKPIEIRAYQKGKNAIYLPTGIRVKPTEWDYTNRRINSTHPLSDLLNKQIADQLYALESFELAMIRRYGGKGFPVGRIREYKSGATAEYRSFTEFWEDELSNSTDKPKTIKTHRTHLKTFHAFNKNKPIYFEEVGVRLIKRYDAYLKNLDSVTSQNTVHNYHKTIKAYINKAIAEDLLQENPYSKYKIKKERDENIVREWLTLEEMQRIEMLHFGEDNRRMGRIQDFILICLWCGFRFGTTKSLAPTHIKQTKDGMVILMRKSPKTDKRIFMPLYLFGEKNDSGLTKPEQLIKDLLDRREREADSDGTFDNLPFFDFTLQHINRLLKDIAKLTKIDKKLTTHIGRRTFINLMNKEFKLPLELVMRLANHSSIAMTLKYIKQDDEDLIQELRKADIKI